MKRSTKSTDARTILKRLQSMGDNGGKWWAFRNESIISSVPDMYTHEGGRYRVVPINEWGARCSAEEVLIVLAHWIQVGSLKLTSGWQLQALVQRDHPVNITVGDIDDDDDDDDDYDADVALGPPPRHAAEDPTHRRGVGPAIPKKVTS